MKLLTYHFILKGKSDYKDLAEIFPDILKLILKENKQISIEGENDEEIREMHIESNVTDLLNNVKPEGYNRKGRYKYRLIFPMDRKEFYIKSTDAKPAEINSLGERIGEMLTSAKVKFETAENDSLDEL